MTFPSRACLIEAAVRKDISPLLLFLRNIRRGPTDITPDPTKQRNLPSDFVLPA